jgi:RNA polymerase sigma-70 factor (ECF subfamily)
MNPGADPSASRLPEPRPPAETESTAELLRRVRTGDSGALDRLCRMFRPRLQRWASGRLPRWARDLMDTEDLVHETLLRTFARLEDFEDRGSGALQAYLRQALLNRLRDEIRRVQRRPGADPLDEDQAAQDASPLEQTIGLQAVERYEEALARLRPEEREAVIGRLEMDCGYAELAEALGKPSADAARVAVGRALLRLAREMGHER